MSEIELQIPTVRHTAAAAEYRRDFLRNREFSADNCGLLTEDYSRWLENNFRNSRETTARQDWVKATTFFAVRKSDKKIVGTTEIRHTLENNVLREYGGHIGYSVCPGERGKGYGTAILKLALAECRGIGLDQVMLSCNEDNAASIRVIEKCGGQLTETKEARQYKIRIYWIDLEETREA
ncbi:MAG: GNAT family N-acetyltransferase [Clostridia bacterium]